MFSNLFMIELSTIIDLVTFGSSIMFGILFFSSKIKNNSGNFYLSLFLFCLGYITFKGIVYDIYEREIFQFDVSLFLLVFLFFYLNKTIGRILNYWWYLLFVPGVLINLTTYFKNLNQILILIHFHQIFYLFTLFLIVYFFKILHVHNSHAKEFYSNIESKTLSWLKLILLIVFSFHFFEFIEALIPTKRADDLEILFSIIYSLIPFSLVYLIGLNGFYQFEIFSGISSNYFIDNFNKNMFIQSKKQSKNDFEQLKQTIIIERLYAKKNLTLYDLSIALKMKKRVISILINDNTDTTFYHFINQLRIEEFKKHLIEVEHQKFTLFGLAQEVGFSSKSTFYTSFKSIEGMTPKQYQSKLKKSVST